MVRFKNRYITFHLTWKDGKYDDAINEAALLGVFRESLLQLFGDYGLGSALASFQVKLYNPVSNICVVRCGRDEYRNVWCAATLITDIRHRVVSLRMLDITGTLRCCKKAAASFNAAVLAERHLTPQQEAANSQALQRLSEMDV